MELNLIQIFFFIFIFTQFYPIGRIGFKVNFYLAKVNTTFL